MRVVDGVRIRVREKEQWWAKEQIRVPHVSLAEDRQVTARVPRRGLVWSGLVVLVLDGGDIYCV